MEEVTFIRTGLAFEIPDGYVMLVFGRSGHTAKYGTSLANCVGVIDSDFRGEVTIMLRAGHSGLDVMPGDRIAQAIVIPRPRAEFELVDELSDTGRGVGGLGSTGA
jgi:dUTP pyrophosphatase